MLNTNLRRLALALDTSDWPTYLRWCRYFGPRVGVLKVGLDEISKICKSAFKNFKPECLTLENCHYHGRRTTIWMYKKNVPSGGYYRDYTKWDADTGALIYSEVLQGGERNSPYLNPAYYSRPTKKEIRVTVEELVKKRAEELEKREGKE